ncbi:hypothetical protein LCL89_00725 [Halobacillus yeomjeoni]|uniref:hypothetical protein n=1 Tax=Halobacillus yeomjeoni TaxID=311194 RepID=UPI001CD4B440|nr:hypothetical protein [Halobacillus yeomjeoni]MCA0982564.1 hypothetical protein [Halobacillus yeomjeoni]
MKNTLDDLVVVSAYVKVDALKVIDENLVHHPRKKRLLVRFRMDDVVSGSSDFELVNYCMENNWELFINFDLHSKILIFDKSQFMLGSANVTLSGLGLSNNPNIESVVLGDLDETQISKVNSLFDNSLRMDSGLSSEMRDQLEKLIDSDKASAPLKWNKEIIDKHNNLTNVEELWCSEMFFSNTPFDMFSSDCSLLGITSRDVGDVDLLRRQFVKTKVFRWFLNSFDDEIYFGRLTKQLHSALIDHPAPYRKDVKEFLSNLINWIRDLQIEGIIIDQPNYSTRIRKVSSHLNDHTKL